MLRNQGKRFQNKDRVFGIKEGSPRGKALKNKTDSKQMTHWKNLKALTMAPEVENSILRSSSTTDGLKNKRNISIKGMLQVVSAWCIRRPQFGLQARS